MQMFKNHDFKARTTGFALHKRVCTTNAQMTSVKLTSTRHLQADQSIAIAMPKRRVKRCKRTHDRTRAKCNSSAVSANYLSR